VDAAVEGVMTAMASHSSNVTGRVTLGTGATACLYLLPHILRSLRVRFPNLSVVVSTGNTADFVKAVEGNSMDMALVTLPVKRRALVTTPLLNDEFVAIAFPNGRRGCRPASRRLSSPGANSCCSSRRPIPA
jgi:DNA-binding transcriptional LysR family regulator